MLYYILQIIAFQLVFLLIYDLFLRRETFFNWNRIYLIGTALLSFVLPFLKFETFKAIAPEDFVILLPAVIIGELSNPEMVSQVALQNSTITTQSQMPIWEMVFWVGFCVASFMFAFKLVKLYVLKSKSPKRWKGNVLLVKLLNSSAAFSFFNTIFMGERIAASEQPKILKHELVHVEQKHTLDLLFFEALRIAMWFNPLVFMYQNRVKTLHEYIADAIVVKEHGKRDYYQSLLNQVFETQHLSFTNTFFKSSLIKKRIAMLQKSKSNQRNLLKYTLLIPIVFGMLIYTSADVKAQVKEGNVETIHETTLINDIEMDYQDLLQKYLKEINERVANGENHIDFSDEYISNNNIYKVSKKQHARANAYMTFVFSKSSEDKRVKELIEKLKNYDQYLEWLETDEAKRRWEGNTRDGVNRLFVEDLRNYTEDEQKRYDKKIKLLFEDDFWHTLIITDGKSRFTMTSKDVVEERKTNTQINDVVTEEIDGSIEVPFSVIENPPTFKECENLAEAKERRDCMSNGIAKFVNRNFNTDLAKELGLSGRQRISVFFKVGKDGKISSISARAPHPDLEEEAKRVIGLLPQFVPGTQRGKVVTVPYSLPIIFQVQNISVSDSPKLDQKSKEVAFKDLDTPPTFKECIDLQSNKDKKDCLSKGIASYVNKNFNTNLGAALNLTGRQRISVYFNIGADGRPTSINAKGSHPVLEEEAKRVIASLPQLVPGQKDGEAVTVPYALPILFQVQSTKKNKN